MKKYGGKKVRPIKDIFGNLTNFIICCIIIGIFSTQIVFTFIIPPSNWMLWQLMDAASILVAWISVRTANASSQDVETEPWCGMRQRVLS